MDSKLPSQMSPEQLLLNTRWVRGLALRLVEDPNVADDVVQQTWLAALERPWRNSGSSEERRAWFSRVLRNFVAQRSRTESRRSNRERKYDLDSARSVTESEQGGNTPPEPGLIEQVDSQRAVVQEALNLSEPTRSTILLRYFKGHSSAEIARMQAVPAATVRSRLSRGLEELRTRMSDRYDGDDSAWCAALLAGLGLESSVGATSSVSSAWFSPEKAILPGVTAMKVGIVLTAALSALALTALGISMMGGDKGADAAELVMSKSESQAPAPATETEPIVVAKTSAAPTREAIIAEPIAVEAKQADVPAERWSTAALEPGRIFVRFVDAGGNAVSGVTWQARELNSGDWRLRGAVQSEADGMARMELELAKATEECLLSYSATGFVRGATKTMLRSGEEINVGTIELTPSVQIEGRVVDASGQPIAGASVFVRGPNLGGAPEGELHRVGPSGPGPGGEALDVQKNVLSQTADAAGQFQIEGGVAGSVRLWAAAEGWRYGWTEPLDLVAGQPLYEVLIVLERLKPEDRIAGVALDAEGNPLPGRYISYEFSDQYMSMSAGLSTDSMGAFDLTVVRPVLHNFNLDGDAEHPGSANKYSVAPGTLDLVLQLSSGDEIMLYVENAESEPITDFKLITRTIHNDSNSTTNFTPFAVDDEHVNVAIPAAHFEFQVSRRGHVTQTLGPYFAVSCPKVIHCVLEQAAGVHGVVLDGDQPIVGAAVRLYRQVRPGVRYMVNDFPARLASSVEDECQTDESGAFVLFPQEGGDYVVRAEPPQNYGLAAVESSALKLSARDIAKGLVLQPELAGSLEVRVIAASNQEAAGTVIGISDGGAVRISARVNSEGVARFNGLRPGPWVVLELDEEISIGAGRSVSATGDIGYSIPWSCTVRAGETEEFELELE